MPCVRGYVKYTRLVKILPLIFLLLDYIFFDSGVEAVPKQSSVSSTESGFLENGTSQWQAVKPLKKGRAPNKTLATSILVKFRNVMVPVVVALIVTAAGLWAKRAIKPKKPDEFQNDLAELKALAKKLRGLNLSYLEFFAKNTFPLFAEMEYDLMNSASILEYKKEFFRETDESEKKVKQKIWQDYLEPFLSNCDLRAMRQSGRINRFMHVAVFNQGFDDIALNTFNVYSGDTPAIDEGVLSKLLDKMKTDGSPHQDILKTELFLRRYKEYFALRGEYLKKKQAILDFIKTMHKDVARLEGEFAKRVNDESLT